MSKGTNLNLGFIAMFAKDKFSLCFDYMLKTACLFVVFRLFCCRAGEHQKVALYSIFISPSNVNEFAVGGRDQYARYDIFSSKYLINLYAMFTSCHQLFDVAAA